MGAHLDNDPPPPAGPPGGGRGPTPGPPPASAVPGSERPPAHPTPPRPDPSPYDETSPEPPPEFVDAISNELMLDPVLLLETGQTYERSSIEKWFQTCRGHGNGECRDPLTGQVLKSTEVVPNYALKGLIQKWADSHKIRDLPTFSRAFSDIRRLGTTLGGTHLSPQRPPQPSPLGRSRLGAAAAAGGAAPGGGAGAGGSPGGPAGASGAGAARPATPAAAAAAAVPAAQAASAGSPVASPAAASPAASPTSYPSIFGAPPPLQPTASAAPSPQQQQPRPAAAQKPQQPSAAAVAAAAGAPPPAGMYPGPDRPMRTAQDKQRALQEALAALQPAALVAGAKGAAAYHAWTLQQLAAEADCKTRMLQSQVVPLAVYLMGQTDLRDAKPALAGLLQRLAVTSPAVATDILTAGGVHALAMMVQSEDRKHRVAGCMALYFMGWLTEQIKSTAASLLVQQAVAQQLPGNPFYAIWRCWEELPPPLPSQPPVSDAWLQQVAAASAAAAAAAAAGADGQHPEGHAAAAAPLPPPPPPQQNVPSTPPDPELQQEWESLALLAQMLSNAAGAAGAAPAAPGGHLSVLDVRGSGMPAVLAHVATSSASTEAAQFAAVAALSGLLRVPSNRAALVAPLVECMACTDWAAAARAAGVLWELCYDEAAGNNFVMLQALQATPQFIPSLASALPSPHSGLRKAATGLLACVLFDGAGHASSGGTAAAVDSQRYVITDGWRHALLAPGAATLPVLLSTAQDTVADPHCAQLALLALANLGAARGAALGGSGAAAPRPEHISVFDKLKEKLEKMGGKGGSGSSSPGPDSGRQVAPGPRGAMLTHDSTVPTLLQLVAWPCGGGDGLLGGGSGSGNWGSGSFASVSPPDTPVSAGSFASGPSAFSFTPIGQLVGGGGSGAFGAIDTAGISRAVLPPALLALSNLVTEQAGREQVRGWAKSSQARMAALQAALNGTMANRQLPAGVQDLARRLLHELSTVPGPLHRALGCRAVPPPPRTPAYPTP